ncbi:hypothetical protein CHS0354_031541, partial [Potamilus streckersoni]
MSTINRNKNETPKTRALTSRNGDKMLRVYPAAQWNRISTAGVGYRQGHCDRCRISPRSTESL